MVRPRLNLRAGDLPALLPLSMTAPEYLWMVGSSMREMAEHLEWLEAQERA